MNIKFCEISVIRGIYNFAVNVKEKKETNINEKKALNTRLSSSIK